MTHKQTRRVEGSCTREHVLSHCYSHSFSLLQSGRQSTRTLTPSNKRGKLIHSDKASHSLIHRMEATLTFTRRQTRRVEGTCTHKHLVSLRDSHSGGQRTHSHALTENGRTTHSHVPTGEKHTHFYSLTQKGKKTHSSSLSQGMEKTLADPITLSHRGDSPFTLILSY